MKREKTVWYQHQDPSTWQPEIPECSMYDLLAQTADRHPDLYALYFEGRRTRYRELMQQIESAARAFQAMGVKKGDIVSVMAPNMPQVVYALYALNRIGAVSNMLHPLLSANEIHRIIRHTGSRLLVVLDQLYEKAGNIPWESAEKPCIILLRVSDALPTAKSILYRCKEKHYTESGSLLYWRTALRQAAHLALQPVSVAAGDTAVILYSSGTTGTPKGAMLSNLNFNAFALQVYDSLGIGNVAGMQVLSILPFSHGAGLAGGLHTTLCYGLQVYLIPTFDLNKCVHIIFKNRIEQIYGVPAFFDGIARSKEMETQSCRFIRAMETCGDKLPDRTRDRINGYLKKSGSDVTITNGYGLTETTAGCCFEPYFQKKRGSSGMMLPDMHFKIVIPGTQTAVPTGEVGELCIAGPTVMNGYYKNQAATDKVLQLHKDGKLWFHSGDAFSADEDGYLYYRQRLDRMFIVSGCNVVPSDIEEEILKTPGVAQCCVVGKKAPVVGHRIVAYLQLQPNVSEAEVLAAVQLRCKQNLSENAQPGQYIVLPEFPLTRMKKTDYKALEKMQ